MAITTNAQQLDFSLSTGTGKSYLIESLTTNRIVKYGLPLSLMTELKFTPKGKSWGLKLRMQNIQSTITGTKLLNNSPLDGIIT